MPPGRHEAIGRPLALVHNKFKLALGAFFDDHNSLTKSGCVAEKLK